MALNFPNASRSYDSTRHAVRFWGYDSAMETSFFVVADALRRLQPGTVPRRAHRMRRLQPGISPDEEGLLQAFDSHCEQIRAAAAKVYRRGNKGSYELGPTDF